MPEELEYELVNVYVGHPRYEDLIGQIRADPWLLERMWADGEHKPPEDIPGKVWSMAVVLDGGRWVPAAWAAAVEVVEAGERLLQCCDNYEHPRWRGHGLYEAAYRLRHDTVVLPSPLPKVTYLFPDPIPLHKHDGWYETGLSDDGELEGHHWRQLRLDSTGYTL